MPVWLALARARPKVVAIDDERHSEADPLFPSLLIPPGRPVIPRHALKVRKMKGERFELRDPIDA